MTARDTAISILEAAAPAVSAGLSAVPVAGPILGPAVAAGLGLVVDLLRAGADVPIEIERIRRSPDVLAAARAELRWEEALARKPRATRRRTQTLPSVPDTLPDPYPPMPHDAGDELD